MPPIVIESTLCTTTKIAMSRNKRMAAWAVEVASTRGTSDLREHGR